MLPLQGQKALLKVHLRGGISIQERYEIFRKLEEERVFLQNALLQNPTAEKWARLQKIIEQIQTTGTV